jgi:cellulose synthase/poly-beta-1,6-N-acetylglucosamine synthase-like glycosyltransferase
VDWDLNARLALRGIQRAYCRDAVVFTERPATIKEFWTNELRWRRAHLRSLFHLSEYFLRDLKTGFTNLYIYGLAWFTGLFTLGLIVILIFGTPEARVIAACLWSLYALWLLLRRAALVIEVTSYTQDLEWLRFIWVPPLLLCLTFGANILATLTLNRISAQFKGPRTNTSLDFRTS